MPSSSISSVRATGLVFFVIVGVSVVVKFVDFILRAGSSGNVMGVDDRFVEALAAPFPLASDVFRELVVSNGDA